MSTPSKWEYFSKEELECPCGCGHGEDMMSDDFMRNMVYLRKQAGAPWPVTSGYRCPDHNDALYVKMGHPPGTHRDGPHTHGRALDIALGHKDADKADRLAVTSGYISGRGWKQHGKVRYLHFDDMPDREQAPRPAIWSYP